MSKKNFVSLIFATVGGILFALGMCMALLPAWNAFQQGVVLGAAGLAVLLIAEPADVGVDGNEQVGVPVGLVGALAQGLVDPVEIGLGGLLVAEHLDHLLAVQHLLDEAVHNAQVLLLLDVVGARQAGEFGSDQQHDHGGDQGDDGEGG